MTAFSSGFGHGLGYAYFAGQFSAPLLMGVALWRSRSVPRWLAVLFFAGLQAAQLASPAGPVVILCMLPFAAAMVLLAARIWQAATRPAASGPVPAGGPVPSPSGGQEAAGNISARPSFSAAGS